MRPEAIRRAEAFTLIELLVVIATQVITADLTRKADAGDATAKARLEAIERSRPQ